MKEKKKSTFRPNLYLRFVFLVMASHIRLIIYGIILFVIVYIVSYKLFNVVLQPTATGFLWSIATIFFVGGVFSSYIGKKFIDPIMELGNAMQRVAQGDFDVQLDSHSKIKEIQDIYANFNRMVKELRSTEILQTDFVSNVSHEFKTPVTAITGYAELLQNTYEHISPRQAQYVEKILFNSKRISTLVGNILLLSKIENQAIPSASTKFRMDEQIRQTVFAMETEWTEKEIEFDADMETVEYIGNEFLLIHVWSNLIGNAVKFSPQGGNIRICLERRDDGIYFVVVDAGPGIDEETQKHIFDKFYQGDTSRRQDGNGLGLALVKRILTLCGGSIEVENIPDGGCRFTVILPISESDTGVA